MARTLPSWFESGRRELVLVAPASASVPPQFTGITFDSDIYDHLLAGMQRLRGSVYLEDGAIRPEHLTDDGRHTSPVDEKSWHVLAIDGEGNVVGCSRYLSHESDVPFEDLVLSRSALARDPQWSNRLRSAVLSDMALAGKRNMAYVEVGGWALDKAARCSTEALRIALGTYALARQLGGCIGVTTATFRHCSATILQKIGGRHLEVEGTALPPYYDSHYECEMMMLRFESDSPNSRYETWVESLRMQLRQLPVVCKNNAGIWQPTSVEMAVCA